MITSLRNPRKRTVSVGPQSEADAYEALAFRDRRRRESLSMSTPNEQLESSLGDIHDKDEGYFSFTSARPSSTSRSNKPTHLSQPESSPTTGDKANGMPPLPGITFQEVVIKDEDASSSPGLSEEDRIVTHVDATSIRSQQGNERDQAGNGQNEDRQDRAVFLRLLRPRVRYDVEVVTKLIVYSGIGFLAVDGNPIVFELCGLGVGRRPPWASFGFN